MISALLAVALFALCVCSFGAGAHTLGDLSKCRKVFAYSGNSCAYFYGTDNTTLYSSRVLPDSVSRSIGVEGVIRAVCHDETCAYALFEQSRRRFRIVKMNMNNGKCSYEDVPFAGELLTTSVACTGSECVVVVSASPYAYAMGFSGNTQYRYAFSANTDSVFVNGGKLYTVTDEGEIYRLSKGSKTLCANITPHSRFINAGKGYLCTEDGVMISVENGSTKQRSGYGVKTAGGYYDFPDGAKAVAVAGEQAAVLRAGGDCETVSFQTKPKENPAQQNTGETLGGGTTVIDAGMTVAQLKKQYTNVRGVYRADGTAVNSGKLKTGFSVALTQGSCLVAVRGDVNASGTVNSEDTAMLMAYFVDSISLDDCALTAADYDRNGSVNNRDLLLIARAGE